ncbi:hypothetical protein TSAR_007708 [Trichomalopsis sarcophagae]|uniref:Uncharacterized protein n=1 Tax=Trichomalopsis sarcophagae TaxID=543379 RepID=A0A232ED15_9HYME|nr:hypothetical protein TSAR_007708 [Trichomalopsis sarcophagae]
MGSNILDHSATDIFHRLVKKLIGLALLPENKIIEGFNVIEEECKETFPNDKRVHAFLDYYRKQWLKNPSNFCVYRLKDRTNNSLESYHRTLKSLLRKTPGLHEFFVELLDIQLMARVEFAQLDGDDDNDDEREEYMAKKLEKAWDQLESIKTIDKNYVAQFLNDVSYFPEIDSFDCTPDDKEGFNGIEEECKETFPNDKRVHAFLDYYRKQWLKNPSNFCVYRLKDRTNNSLESYHRTLNSLLRKTPGLH